MVYSAAFGHEANLLRLAAAPDGWQSTTEQDPDKEHAGDREKCNVSMVAAD